MPARRLKAPGEVSVAIRSELVCPGCDRQQLGILPRSGDLWLRCLNRHCAMALWVIVIPAGATTADLGDILGSRWGARALVRKASPALATVADPMLDEMSLAGPGHGAFIVIGAPGRYRPSHQHSTGEDVLRTLGIL